MALGIELFAHINNDAFIAGTRNLEGLSHTETIRFLQDFLENQAQIFLPAEGLQAQAENVDHLGQRLTSLLQATQELQGTSNTDPLVNRILKLDPKKELSVLMKGGWSGSAGAPGHAMVYEFQKNKDGNLIFMVYNSGAGLGSYHKAVPSIDKVRFETVKSFKIPKKNITKSNLNYFIQELAKVSAAPQAGENFERNEDYLYEQVIRKIAYLKGKEVEPGSVKFAAGKSKVSNVSMAQRAGTCTEKSLHELIKNDISDRRLAKLILLSLKIYSIELFLEQEQKNGLHAKSLQQLQLATSNLSTILLKSKSIPKNIEDRAQAVIRKVELLSKAQTKNSGSVTKSISPSDLKAREHQWCLVNTPIILQPSKKTIIEKPYNLNKQNYVVEAIHPTLFSMDKLVEFHKNMDQLITAEYHQDAEKQILEYLTTIPLNKAYFASINTPKLAGQYVDNIHTLLIKVRACCEAKGEKQLSPEKTVAIFSVLDSLDLLCQDKNLGFHPAGINAISSTWRDNFSYLKDTLEYNAHLATKTPLLDARMKEILNKTSPSLGEANLGYVTKYLNKPKNKGLNDYLKKIYAEKSVLDFSQDEKQLIGEKGYQAAVSYLYYLEDFPDKYVEETQKVAFLKKSITLLNCSNEAMSKYSLASFSERSDQPKKSKPVTVEEYNQKKYLREQYLSKTESKLAKEPAIAYFNKIQDPLVQNTLETDFLFDKRDKKTVPREVNIVFSKLNGKDNVSTKPENNSLYQELRHLRLEPALQFLTTLDFFSERLELFATKKLGNTLPSDLKEYLCRNLFQDDIILQGLQNNPKALSCFNEFIEKAIIYFDTDVSTQLYFYQLQADMNHYVFNMDLEKDKRFEGLKQSIKATQNTLMSRLLKIDATKISTTDKYILAKIKLQLKLGTVTEQNKSDPEYSRNFFNLFIEFSQLSRDCNLSSPQQRAEHEQLTVACLEKLSTHKDHIYDWALQKHCDDNKIQLDSLAQKGKFPYYYAIDHEGKVQLSIDLTIGQILTSNKYFAYPPNRLVNSTVWKEALGESLPNLSVTIGLDGKKLTKQYEVLHSNSKERFIEKETYNIFYKKIWGVVYQKEITVGNQTGFYEKQNVKTQQDKPTLNINENIINGISYNFPECFSGKETHFWVALDKSEIFVEQNHHRYRLDVARDSIEELDENNQSTGFMLINHQDWLDRFEDPEFTQVFLKTEPSGEQRVRIHFPRYNLSLEGHFDKQQNKWIIHPVGKPNLILMEPFQSNTDPKLNNSLVFETLGKKEQVIYTPNQYYYVNKKAEKARSEASFSTVYHDPILDRTNIVKRMVLDLGIPELAIESNPEAVEAFPEGRVNYSNSEHFFVYSIDPKTQKVRAASTEAQLYLAYSSLIEQEPEAALTHIQALTKLGGLKGTAKELEMILKIIAGVPVLAKQIDSPKYIAVRTHLLYHCSVLMSQKGHFSIPDSEKLPDSTPDEYIAKKLNARLEALQNKLPALTLGVLDNYRNTRIHIPLNMQLSSAEEYQLLRKSKAKTKGKLPLQARYFELKREHLLKEQHRIQSLSKQSEVKYKSRVSKISKSLEKKYKAETVKTKLGIVKRIVELQNTENSLIMLNISDEWYKQKSEKINLKPGMSNDEFREQFASIYKVATQPFNSQHRQLKEFLKQTLESNSLKPDDNQKQMISAWAATLLVVTKNPRRFKNLESKEAIIKKAHQLSPKITIETIGYIKTRDTIDVTPKKRHDEQYLIPLPIISSPDESIYSEFDYSHFIKNNGLMNFNQEMDALRETTEKRILELRENLKAKTENKRYIETVDLFFACDEEVGHLKNEETVERYKITQHHLKDPFFRQAILKNVTDSIPILSKRSKDNQNQALALANRGPLDPALLKSYQLERSAGIRKKLKLGDLNRLFVLADMNEYRKVTGLDKDEDIQNLHNAMANSIQCSILKTQYKKIKKSLIGVSGLDFNDVENTVDIMQLGNTLTDQNKVLATESALQFFQKEEKILMKPMQIEAFNQLASKNPNTNEFNNTVIQLIMGAGKSKVIAPTTALIKANGSNLVIQQVKSSLLKTAYADECEKSYRLYNRIPFLFEFERVPMNFLSVTNEAGHKVLQSDKWKHLYHDLKTVMLEKNFILTSGPSLQSLELQYLDTLDQEPPKDPKQQQEWLKQIKALEKILVLMKSYGERVIDEIHDELDPSKALNHTIGLPQSASKEDLILHIDLFFFLRNVNVQSILNTDSQKTVYDLILNNTLISNPDVQIDKIMRSIALGLMTDQSAENPLSSTVKKMKLSDQQKECFVNYLLNQKADANLLLLFNQLTPREREEIAWIKFELSKVLPFTLLKNYNENYGASKLANLSELQKRLAIPYSAISTPNEKSRFGQFIESLNYSTQMNLVEPLTEPLIEEVIESYLAQVKEERMLSPGTSFEETQASKDFNRLFGQSIPTTLYAILNHTKAERDTIVQKFKSSENFLKAILSEKILPLVKKDIHVLSSDNQNLGSMTNTTQGMSATPSNYRAYPSEIHFDEVGSIGTDGETIDQLKRKKTKVIVCDSVGSDEKLFLEAMANCSEADKVRALIDIGGLFKNVSSNLEMAKIIGNYYASPNAACKTIKYVLYFDNTDNMLYAWDIANQTKIFVGGSDEKEISKILNCSPDERFTYYDQARITGTDIVQALYAHALVTISEKTTQSAFLQGVKRLRQFSNKQSATIIEPRYIVNRANPDIDSVLNFVRKNQTDKYLQLHLKGSVKKFKNVVRRDLLDRIYLEKDLIKKTKLLSTFRSLFVTSYEDNYFEQYGLVESELQASDYFRQIESSYYSKWETMLHSVNLNISEEDKSKMKNKLGDLSKEGVRACADTIKGASDLGLEVENENENEIENELELEKQTIVYDASLKPNLSDGNFKLAVGLRRVFLSFVKQLILGVVTLWQVITGFIAKIFNRPFKKSSVALKSFDNLVPANSDLLLKDIFDANLFISAKQVWTLENGESKGARLKTYHNGYIKPVHAVMMIASKTDPNHSLECVILTTNEVKAYLHKGNEALAQQYPKHDVWFVSPNELLLGGTPPSVLPKNYNRMLEQVRFINGDIKQIIQQEKLSWLSENTAKKMKFLEEKVLSYFPHKAKYYPTLQKQAMPLDSTARGKEPIKSVNKLHASLLKDLPSMNKTKKIATTSTKKPSKSSKKH